MTKRQASLLLDGVMFALFLGLTSWRMTGVPVHEWVGLALIATIFTHLVIHWGWVERRVTSMRRVERRRWLALALNTTLFLAMGTALVSGVVISKVVFPNHLTPESYLAWHGIHENASTVALIVLALHLALNWDRIRVALRRRLGPAVAVDLPSATPPRLVVRRAAWVLAVCVLLIMLVRGVGAVAPAHGKVMFTYPDGRRELAAPPAEITALRPGTERPSSGGEPRLFMSLIMLGVVLGVGRWVFRLPRHL